MTQHVALTSRNEDTPPYLPADFLTRGWKADAAHSPRKDFAWGLTLLFVSGIFLACVLYACVISKILPPTGWPVLDAIRDDWYYCFLVPLTAPVTVAAIILHWFCTKTFQHN
eukprot:jgi/Mesvir1/13301/Mv08591-RA.1